MTDFDRVIDQPADLKSSSDMAVIISSHKSTVGMMNSIHTLLSENHPCTLFMASLHPGYHAPIEQDTLSHLRQMTEQVPEIAPELTGHGLPLVKCEAYNRVYDQPYGSS
jgi:hypothetical protein